MFGSVFRPVNEFCIKLFEEDIDDSSCFRASQAMFCRESSISCSYITEGYDTKYNPHQFRQHRKSTSPILDKKNTIISNVSECQDGARILHCTPVILFPQSIINFQRFCSHNFETGTHNRGVHGCVNRNQKHHTLKLEPPYNPEVDNQSVSFSTHVLSSTQFCRCLAWHLDL